MGSLLPNGRGQYLQIGFPCSNFSGYCDFFNQCMIVDNDGALNRLANFFLNSVGIQQAIDWITRMWWVAVIVIVGVLVIMFVIVIIFHMIIPRPKYQRKLTKNQTGYSNALYRCMVQHIVVATKNSTIKLTVIAS